MIKGEISRSAEVNREEQPDYKRKKEERWAPFCEQPEDLHYFKEAHRVCTYFCECRHDAGLILGVLSAREAPN